MLGDWLLRHVEFWTASQGAVRPLVQLRSLASFGEAGPTDRPSIAMA